MKYIIGASALFAATASADLCSLGSALVGGNWYCQKVNAITYTGVGSAGSYNRVTNMDSTTGECTSTPYSYSGTLAPLDEEVSLHFRGPLNLKQFAAYTPGNSSSTASSKKVRRTATERRHAHGHNHAHLHKAREAARKEERQVGAWVTVTMDGQVVSWINEWSGEATSAPVAVAAAPTSPAAAPVAANTGAPAAPAQSKSSSSGNSGSSSGSSSASTFGGWSRQAYYNSESASMNGLVFLNHMGGAISGTFDMEFGNSLSYASSDGQNAAPDSQLLADTTLPSNTEVVIMSSQKCSGQDGDCGYYRNNTVPFHGFAGPAKAFLFEFSMPDDHQTSDSIYVPTNMPAIWMLNAQIPRTLQYGNGACSCWQSGCGEFDIFEVLSAGDTRAKSTLHGNVAGGDSDYFARPTTGPMKLALVLYENNIHIKVLPDSTIFGESVAESFLNDIISTSSTQGTGVSLFALAG